MRAMIDCYPLLAIPFASFVHWIWSRCSTLKIPFTIILLGLITLNQFQQQQYIRTAIHWDAMSKELYWKGFGKLDPIPEYHQLLDTINYKAAQKGFR